MSITCVHAERHPALRGGLVTAGRADRDEPERGDVPNLERVVRLPAASHWVHHDEPERVSELLVEFFG